MKPEDEQYFDEIETELDRAIELAEEAKSRGEDPRPEVEIPTARDMADRVENILGIEGVAERVRELEEEFSREEAALELVEDFVEGRVGSYESDAGKIEGAVRTAVALLTEGVVAAPIEGIDRVEIEQNDDGTDYVTVAYAGPIRSAGGTAQALSVLVADYARSLLDVGAFKPRDDEIERYAEEIELYSNETGLQYTPKDKESKFITEHCPVMLDGEATSDEEVSGFRDLERIDTNSARGGMCLVLAEGIALKAPKIQRYTRNLEEVEWPWLQDLIDGTIGKEDGESTDAEAAEDGEDDGDAVDDGDSEEAAEESDAPDGPPRVDPNGKFLLDLIAGRPVFGHPSESGGFRLRYGRSRNLGDATAGVHPATMRLVDDFLAPGTQIKTELPGKAAGVVPVDSIEGPTVRLANGDVRRIADDAEAKEVRNGVEAILDLGEYLVNYGEFVENNHPLAPAAYATEWWIQDFEAAGVDVQALADDPAVDLEAPDPETAIEWAEAHDAPLHPDYTYVWHDVSVEDADRLASAIATGDVRRVDAGPEGAVAPDGGTAATAPAGDATDADELVLEADPEGDVARTLETLLVPHRQREDEIVVPTWRPLASSLGLTDDRERSWALEDLPEDAREWENAVQVVNAVAPFEIREKAPTRVGCRMGRPEKSEDRELSPAVHTLFPIGDAGGDQRDVGAATHHADSLSETPGEITVEIGVRRCADCQTETHKSRCPDCGEHIEPHYTCPDCDMVLQPDDAGRVQCDRCELEGSAVEERRIDVGEAYHDAMNAVGERDHAFDMLKGVKGLTSELKTPEPIEKGVLRAKHDVSAFKDGTVRYDMTDLPVTAVKPAELDVSVDQFRELGYEEDVNGETLTHEDQVVELKVQDVILSEGGADHMLKTAAFVDDLLESYYGLDPYYELEDKDDLVGELVFGMAPHTSAAVVGRVIGTTNVAGGYAHPYFHAAKRRNCFHPETPIWYKDEAGQWHHQAIEEVVEPRLESPDTDDFGTESTELTAPIRVPTTTEGDTRSVGSVETVSKHPAPDHLVRVETRSGRELRVTPDHTMLVENGDGVQELRASEVQVGHSLPSPKSIDFEGTPHRFDLLDELLDVETVSNEDLVIRNIGESTLKSILDDATDSGQYLKPIATALDVSTSTVYNWVNRDSIPASVLLEFYDTEELLRRVPESVELGVRRDGTSVARQLEIDEELATVFGYYAAEGFSRQESGSFYQTTICIPDRTARDQIIETFESSFGIDAFEENEWKVTVSSRLVNALFEEVFEFGTKAEEKRIPDFLLDAPTPQLRAFLAAYFSGDGSASADRIEIRAHTISDTLKDDLVAALKRFGVACKTYSERRSPETGAVAEFYEEVPEFESWVLKITSEHAAVFADDIGFHLERKQAAIEESLDSTPLRSQRLFGDGGDQWLDEVVDVEPVESDVEYTYCLTVEETHTLVANDLFVGQCDGDEDCVMLLLDGLLNFSKTYLPDQRGGRMDAPLVMSSRIDPQEIDDEAHNVDVVDQYPREFYEATRELADPEDVDVEIVEDTLGTDEEYSGFGFTHETTDIAAGPDLSAYKTLDSMMDKMNAQLELARTLRAVDETDVAERVIEYHFLPDLIGNLRAFSRQEVRCLDCGQKFRRAPLTRECRECGGDITLTVHEGSVNKYMETAMEVAEEYGARKYTKQRLEVLEKSIDRVFENDKNKASSLDDFM
ncbi:DNA polymerase II large subunit [Salinarchaeum laminariae]|uniref:DNA polymerase II large subunit n=1 Tax=Salinarchaeum laminariae TaxID=869888 RepID=UPI0020BE1F94|nr:DNA polymerase II large subunit [Salinarchaeum laminariae]